MKTCQITTLNFRAKNETLRLNFRGENLDFDF